MNVAALYQLFTSVIHFSASQEDQSAMEGLAKLGLATPASQGHAEGYRISPAGWREAMSRWGVKQQEALS